MNLYYEMDDDNNGEGAEQIEDGEREMTRKEQLEKDVRKAVSFPSMDVLENEAPSQTIFESFYEPYILKPWEDDSIPRSNRSRQLRNTIKDQTIMLNDTNADRFGNVSRVGWHGRVQYALAEYNEQKARKLATRHEIQQDLDRLLNITVATLIMLARKKTIPKEYFMFTELYLRSIQNEYGDRPPNIRNFLKYMRYLKKKNNYDWGEVSHVVPPKNLIIAKIGEEDMKSAINRSMDANRNLNRSRIPVMAKKKYSKSFIRIRRPMEKSEEDEKKGVMADAKQEKHVEYFSNSPVTSDMILAGGSFGDKFASTPKSSRTDMK